MIFVFINLSGAWVAEWEAHFGEKAFWITTGLNTARVKINWQLILFFHLILYIYFLFLFLFYFSQAIDEKEDDAISGALKELTQKKNHLEENRRLVNDIKVRHYCPLLNISLGLVVWLGSNWHGGICQDANLRNTLLESILILTSNDKEIYVTNGIKLQLTNSSIVPHNLMWDYLIVTKICYIWPFLSLQKFANFVMCITGSFIVSRKLFFRLWLPFMSLDCRGGSIQIHIFFDQLVGWIQYSSPFAKCFNTDKWRKGKTLPTLFSQSFCEECSNFS